MNANVAWTPADPLLACPACGEPLVHVGGSFHCINSHTFDVAREGYVNLVLAQHRRAKDPGYSREMIAARQQFFETAHYQRLADGIAAISLSYLQPESKREQVVLDAGCGEGYYLRRIRAELNRTECGARIGLCGVDISKHGIRVAAKRDARGIYIVGNTHRLPVLAGRIDVLLAHFSPVIGEEFRRVLRANGVVLVGVPGPEHLFSLKSLIYKSPARHADADPLGGQAGFTRITSHRIRYGIALRGPGSVANLLLMTPYYWTASRKTQVELSTLSELDTEVDATIHVYRCLPARGKT
jgi:23S rRNA (guanine745-N1)-methyltransferase